MPEGDTIHRAAHHLRMALAGKTVEEGPCQDIFDRPMHPYTQGLLALLPRLDGLSAEGLAVA